MTTEDTKALKDHLAALDLPPDDPMVGVVVAVFEALDRHLESESLSESRRVIGEAAMKRLGVLEARDKRVREVLDNFDADPGKMLMMSFPAGTTPKVLDALCSLVRQIRYALDAKEPA